MVLKVSDCGRKHLAPMLWPCNISGATITGPIIYAYDTLANTHVGYRTHGQMTVKKAVA